LHVTDLDDRPTTPLPIGNPMPVFLPSGPPPPMSPPAAPSGAPARILTRLRPEGPELGGWHQNWIAIALSSDVKPGQMIGRGLFGERVLIARSHTGTPSVLTAYCRHFGADLSFGGIVRSNDCVTCPFHHWQYDMTTGNGVSNGFGEPLPEHARLFAFPTHERYGVIWAFNGPTATHPVPSLALPDDELEIAAIQITEGRTQETWVPFSNSHDFVHLGFLHRVSFSDGPNNFALTPSGGGHDVTFELPTGKRYAHRVSITGTNSVLLDVTIVGTEKRFLNMFTSIETDQGSNLVTIITAAPKALGRAGVQDLMSESFAYGLYLSAEDDPVVKNARFVPDVVDPERDRPLMMYIDYVKNFPRHNPFSVYPAG
jgi:nitrite reductase/ring-hydroxylating ferredoxin subunit